MQHISPTSTHHNRLSSGRYALFACMLPPVFLLAFQLVLRLHTRRLCKAQKAYHRRNENNNF